MKNKSIFYVYILVLLFSCKTSKNATPWIKQPSAIPFREYLIANNISFDETNDDIYDTRYYDDFRAFKIKTKLEKNPFIKINQVYSFYSETENQTFGTIIDEGKQSVTFVIYADDNFFYLSTFDLSSDEFSATENGKVKLRKSVIVKYFGDYELINDFLKTRKRNQSPYKEWVDYQNGKIKNDTIFFAERYIGKKYKFEKKWWAIKHKENWTEIYQPNLKAVKYKSKSGLTCFEVTGEFNLTR